MDFDLEKPFPDLEEEKLLSKLFESEADFMVAENYYQKTSSINQRIKAVRYIKQYTIPINEEEADSYVPLLALNYYDRFASRETVQDEPYHRLKFFVVCCISLAWKMRNEFFDMRAYLESRLLNMFEIEEIGRTEFQIISLLNQRVRSITPLAFLDFVASLLNIQEAQSIRDLKSRTITSIIDRTFSEIKFTQFKPSIIAASAILNEFKSSAQYHDFKEAIASNQFVNRDDLVKCIAEFETGTMPFHPHLPYNLSTGLVVTSEAHTSASMGGMMNEKERSSQVDNTTIPHHQPLKTKEMLNLVQERESSVNPSNKRGNEE